MSVIAYRARTLAPGPVHLDLAPRTWPHGTETSYRARTLAPGPVHLDLAPRVGLFTGLLEVTLPASFAAMAIVDKRSDRKVTPTRKILTVGCLQLVTMFVLATSYEFGFPYMIHQLGWKLFGRPTEFYSFQNLVLHRIIAWLLCTCPIVWAAVWIYTGPRPSKLADDQPRSGRAAPAHCRIG